MVEDGSIEILRVDAIEIEGETVSWIRVNEHRECITVGELLLNSEHLAVSLFKSAKFNFSLGRG